MKKGQAILISVTAAFLCLILGFFIGRNTVGTIGVNRPENQNVQSNKAQTQIDGRANINDITADQLELIPGIGEVIAQNIVAYREENGPFQSAGELLNVEGIGQQRLYDLLNYVYIPE